MTTTVTEKSLPTPVKQLLEFLGSRPEIKQLQESVENSERLVVEGVLRSARGPVWSTLRGFAERPQPGPSLWVTPTSDSAEVLVEDIRAMGLDVNLVYFPFREERTATEEARPVDPMQLAALERLQGASKEDSLMVVAPIRSLLQKTMSRSALEQSRWMVKKGEMTDRDTLLEMLVSEGYHRETMVERRGEFSARGDIVDIKGNGAIQKGMRSVKK